MESAAPPIEEPARTVPPSGERPRPSAEDIAWVGLWPVALVLLAAMIWLAPPLSHLIAGPTFQFFPQWRGIVKPEPVESVRFLIALAAPVALAVAVLRGSARPAERRLDAAAIALQVAGIGLVLWSVLEQVDGPYPPFVPDAPGYFDRYLLSVPVLLIGVAVGVGLTILALTRERLFDLLGPPRSRKWGVAAFVAAIVLTALWLLPAVITDANVASSGQIPSGHIPTQAEDYFAVVNGRTPLVNFAAQYVQLLPLAVAPVLKAFDLSLTAFSVVMVVLSLGVLLAIFGALKEVTERPLAALALYVPFLALSLFPWAHHGLAREFNGNYYGFFPGRYLGPFVVIWLCALYVRRRRIPLWLLFFVAGVAAFNNAEFGVPSVLALVVALILGSDSAEGWASIMRRLLAPAIIGLVGAVGLVCLVTLLKAGQLPDPYLLTYYSRLFARESLGLEPMPTLGLHIPMYITYVAAVLLAAVRFVRMERGYTLTAMLAFSGVFGLLGGTYFAGRSLPWQLLLLLPMWAFALALLGWAAWLYLRSAPGGSLRRLLLPSLAAMVGFGVMVAAVITFPPPWRQFERLAESGPAVNDVPATRQFIERQTTGGEAILLYGTPIDHRVAEQAGVENVSPWNSALSLFSTREVDRALQALDRSGGSKVFLMRATLQGLLGDRGPVLNLLRANGYRRAAAAQKSHILLFQKVGGGL